MTGLSWATTNAYAATYSPEQDAGYYAVTTDLGIPIAAARTRLADPTGAITGETEDAAVHQTVLVFSRFSAAQIDATLGQVREAVTAAGIDAWFYY